MKQSAGERTKENILKAGVKLWPDVSLSAVARAVGLTHPAVLYHFPDDTLKNAIAAYAVQKNNSQVIVQLIATGHAAVAKLSSADRTKHLSCM